MLQLKTASTAEPIDSTYYKQYLRLSPDVTADDTMLANIAKAARLYAESVYNAAFVTQTWLAYFDSWEDVAIWKQPVQSVSSIKYYASAGTTLTTLSSSDYYIDTTSFPIRVVPKPGSYFPPTDGRINGIVIEFVAGWAVADVPENAKLGLIQIMRTIYDNPGDINAGNIINALPFTSRVFLESIFKPAY